MIRDHLRLHFIVALAGLTAILGRLISIPAVALVFWRTLFAVTALIVLVAAGDRLRDVPTGRRVAFFLNGFVIGLHWCLFFLAVKLANVSVCMIGIATICLWTSLLEPLMRRHRPVRRHEIVLGLVMIAAIFLVFRSDFRFGAGLAVAIGAALVAAIFSIINGIITPQHDPLAVAAFEMGGAMTFCALLLPWAGRFEGTGEAVRLVPEGLDYLWIGILALVCTVFAYTQYISLLKRLSVFSVNLAFNLEPVYGITFAALVFQEYRELGSGFYLGAVVILGAVACHPILHRRWERVHVGTGGHRPA